MDVRDSRLDSAKGILISLVVFGHLLEATSYWDDDLIRYLLTAIYAFHMPAFIFLAGMTSKPDNMKRRVAVLVSLLIIFQCLYSAYLPLTESNKQFGWFDPFWMLWFLLAMVFWLIAIRLAPASPRLAFGLSLAVGLGSGALPAVEYLPVLDRTLNFLPWFMAGYLFGQTIIDKVATLSRAFTLALSLASLILATALWHANIGASWLYGSNGFTILNVTVEHGLLVRAMLIFIAIIMSLTLMTWASTLRIIFVKAGKRSLSIYLLHGFFVLAATPWLGLAIEQHGAFLAILICTFITSILIYLLSLSPFDKGLRALGSRSAELLIQVISGLGRAPGTLLANSRD